ncbi:unnamed protein product [Ectocarpus sp. 12 AP-2014]
MPPNPRTIQLWRRCLRCCRAMEGAMGNYYRGFAREHIVAHREEDDAERVEHLLDKGEQNLRFVLRKYRMTEPRPPESLGTPERTRTKKTRRRQAAAKQRAAGRQEAEGAAGWGNNSSTWTPGR